MAELPEKFWIWADGSKALRHTGQKPKNNDEYISGESESEKELKMAHPSEQYLSNEYLAHNPTWDMEDAPWKARIVAAALE